MEQGYFYTLSAIAQSFAAIIALNGIFVIFKLQALTNQRKGCGVKSRIVNRKWSPRVEVSGMTLFKIRGSDLDIGHF